MIAKGDRVEYKAQEIELTNPRSVAEGQAIVARRVLVQSSTMHYM